MKRFVVSMICLLASFSAVGEDKAAVAEPGPAAATEARDPAFSSKGLALATIRPIRITGQVIDIRDDAIVVQKGKEKWEIARHPAAPIKGDLKKGARVTVDFRAIAAHVEVREEKK